jgi:hypothetical protein
VVGDGVRPRLELGQPVHGAAQGLRADFVKLYLLLSRRPPVRPLCDPLHRPFDTLFAALVKQGSFSGASDLHGLRYAAQVDGPEGMQDAALGGHLQMQQA